ncbi:MAG: hypothetical protein OEV55_02355 [candidate division Zixibacteria bacterium]|nr:hypothetical protein [candidate division Zixibacteria bacterium]
MTNTEDKLLEAEYFLKCMIENQTERDAFKYNLSAFLSAFRSITLIMQKEFNKHPVFADWYSIQRNKLKTDKKMNSLNTKRVMTIHLQPLEPHAQINVNIANHISLISNVSAVLIHEGGSEELSRSPAVMLPSTPSETKTIVQWLWYFEDIPDIDIVTLCQDCMNKLKVIVLECKQKFGSSS